MAAAVCRRAGSPVWPASYPPTVVRRGLRRFFQGLAVLPVPEYSPSCDLAASNSHIQELGRLGRTEEARCLFDGMPQRDVVTWNSMIAAYSHRGLADEARVLFDTFAGRNIRTWTILVSGYAKGGQIDEARRLFDAMPERNVVSWNAMISGYVQNGDITSARHLFEQMPERNVVSWNSMITGYCHARLMSEARELFEMMPEKNLVSWTVMISGFVQIQKFGEAWDVFVQMLSRGVRPDQSNFVAATSAVTGLGNLKLLESLRTLAMKANFEGDVVVGTAILNMYTRYDTRLDLAFRFFEGMLEKNEYSWSTMISALSQIGRLDDAISVYDKDPEKTIPSRCAMLTGYAQNGRVHEARQLFEQTRNPTVVSWNAMIAGYSQNGMIEEAMELFDRMPVRNSITWAAMISGCAQNGKNEDSLQLLAELHRRGMLPSHSCLTTSFFACGNIGALEMGRQVHSLAIKVGSHFNSFVGNALITMYSKCKKFGRFGHFVCNALITMYFKCGCVDAFGVFDDMPERDIVSWNSVLAGCAQHGFGREAIKVFEQMKAEGVLPNHVTFVAVLCACSHAGLVDEGRHYFNSMSSDYGLMPLNGHYACMVDLLGRAGRLCEAKDLISDMPIEPDSVVWGALLGACRIHQNAELGRKVAERLFQMEPGNSGSYILLSNIYASLGMWDEVGKVRKLMRDRGVSKEPGRSWTQTKNRLQYFVTGDRQHEQIEEMHALLKEFYGKLKANGYLPETNCVLHDIEEEQKENVLLCHSEKLAVAYSLLNTPSGTPIQIIKNLRICGDCHTFIKLYPRKLGERLMSGMEIDSTILLMELAHVEITGE
ncbi:unnamed protein product [Spirodela intermedia]|uniref:DYW domain-containing protein n=1 Tax=Spirodela intermedia TaxID=51605 RepID=A0A7I8JEI3_SPIIN|nr:unnamed protein product [Spirodela intermedia]CAA6668529.1 unnamed protein product [Spirodela intermedia]